MTEQQKHKLARQLTLLMKRRVDFKLHPSMTWNEDLIDESRGHCWIGHYNDPDDEDGPWSLLANVDDRQGTVPDLLCKELRRIAGIFESLAKRVEEGTAKPHKESLRVKHAKKRDERVGAA